MEADGEFLQSRVVQEAANPVTMIRTMRSAGRDLDLMQLEKFPSIAEDRGTKSSNLEKRQKKVRIVSDFHDRIQSKIDHSDLLT